VGSWEGLLGGRISIGARRIGFTAEGSLSYGKSPAQKLAEDVETDVFEGC